MPEKGTCLASCRGELRAGPSGWMHQNSEVLELLLSRERNSVPLMYSGVLFGNLFRIFSLKDGQFLSFMLFSCFEWIFMNKI